MELIPFLYPLLENCLGLWSLLLIPRGPFFLQWVNSMGEEYAASVDNVIGFPLIPFTTSVYIAHLLCNLFFFFKLLIVECKCTSEEQCRNNSSCTAYSYWTLFDIFFSYSFACHKDYILHFFGPPAPIYIVDFILRQIVLNLASLMSPKLFNLMTGFFFLMWIDTLRYRLKRRNSRWGILIEDETLVLDSSEKFFKGYKKFLAEEVKNEANEPSKDRKNKKVRPSCARPKCSSVSSHRCSRCKAISYCSQDCSSEDWAHHQIFCNYIFEANKVTESSIVENTDPGYELTREVYF